MKGRPWLIRQRAKHQRCVRKPSGKAGKIREKLAEEGADYLEKAVAAAEEDIASLKWNAGKKTEEVINKVISELI